MSFAAAVCALSGLAACNGVSVFPEVADEGRRFGQTGTAQRQRIEAHDSLGAASESQLQGMAIAASVVEAQTEKAQTEVLDSMRREGDWAEREASEIMKSQRIMEAEERKRKTDERKLRHGEEVQRQKEAEKAEDEIRVARLVEEKHRAEEEWETAHKFTAAQREAGEKRQAEQAYKATLNQRRTEMALELWKQADDLRAKAEQGQLRKDAIEQLLGSSSEKVAADLVGGLVQAVSNDHFRAAVRGLRLRPFSAQFMEGIKHKSEEFAQANEGVNQQQFMPLLAKFLNESQQDLRRHEEGMSSIGNVLKAYTSEQLKQNLALILGNITVSSTLFNVDTQQLAQSNSSEACQTLAHICTVAAPQYAMLAQMKEVLDMTSKMVPQMVSEFPKTKYEVGPIANSLLNMAYAEHIALKEASSAFISKAAPIIENRLHCTFSGAVPRASLRLLAAALSVVAAWFAL